MYKPYHGSKEVGNNGYYYNGNLIVYNPALATKSRRYSVDYEMQPKTPNKKTARLRSSSKNSWSLMEEPKMSKLSPLVRSPRNRPINPGLYTTC